jgi:hypothetical protein
MTGSSSNGAVGSEAKVIGPKGRLMRKANRTTLGEGESRRDSLNGPIASY